MKNLYVLEPGSFIRISGDTLIIEQNGKKLREIPARGLQSLILMGRCSMTGAVLDFLIDNGVDTVFMTLTGRFRARLLLDTAGHVQLRQLQYRRLGEKSFCLKTAINIVKIKLNNQVNFLIRKSYRERTQKLKQVIVQLKLLFKKVSQASTLDEVRGLEGASARIFYQGYGLLIKNENFSFTGRNKHPPLDPVNALLSFVYTLFTNQVVNAIKASGLDPYLGALHEPAKGRPSLACDLVEEWRASAENFVLTIVNKRMVRPDDFVKTGRRDRPIEMAPSFIRALLKAYEYKMATQININGQKMAMRWAIQQRVRDFIKYLEDPDSGW